VNKRGNKGEIRVVVKPVRLIRSTGKERLVCKRRERRFEKRQETHDQRQQAQLYDQAASLRHTVHDIYNGVLGTGIRVVQPSSTVVD